MGGIALQPNGAGGIIAALGAFFLVFMLLFAVVPIAGMAKAFSKAGQPWWAAIVPIYNLFIMTRMANKPPWWLAVIIFVPLVNLYFLFVLFKEIATRFGKGTGFTLGLIFLPFIFWPLLGFGSATYQGGGRSQPSMNV